VEQVQTQVDQLAIYEQPALEAVALDFPDDVAAITPDGEGLE
jgi:hypothetical protein